MTQHQKLAQFWRSLLAAAPEEGVPPQLLDRIAVVSAPQAQRYAARLDMRYAQRRVVLTVGTQAVADPLGPMAVARQALAACEALLYEVPESYARRLGTAARRRHLWHLEQTEGGTE